MLICGQKKEIKAHASLCLNLIVIGNFDEICFQRYFFTGKSNQKNTESLFAVFNHYSGTTHGQRSKIAMAGADLWPVAKKAQNIKLVLCFILRGKLILLKKYRYFFNRNKTIIVIQSLIYFPWS